MERTILSVLDRIEAMRTRAVEHPDAYSVDYCLRVTEGIISSAFGFHSRDEWMTRLREDPTSMQYKRAHR